MQKFIYRRLIGIGFGIIVGTITLWILLQGIASLLEYNRTPIGSPLRIIGYILLGIIGITGLLLCCIPVFFKLEEKK